MSSVTLFDGPTFDPAQDGERLGRQLVDVFGVMKDGRWHTLREVSDAVGAPEGSVSARLRDLRKPRFGRHTVEKRRVSGAPGLWEYRMTGGGR